MPEQVRRVRADGRFSGFILYETSDFIRFDAQGGASNIWPALETLKVAQALSFGESNSHPGQ